MCQKGPSFKRFFVLLNHPLKLTKPVVMGVIKPRPGLEQIVSKPHTYLTEAQIQTLGHTPSVEMRAFLVPIEIPREWVLM